MHHRPKHISKAYLSATQALYGVATPEPIKPRKRALMRPQAIKRSEAQEQACLVQWLRAQGLLVHSIPNHGKRSLWAGERERTMGLLKGVCDLFLAEPRGKYHGFYIELKSRGGKLRPEQAEFIAQTRQRGYAAAMYDSFEAAQAAIGKYLKC